MTTMRGVGNDLRITSHELCMPMVVGSHNPTRVPHTSISRRHAPVFRRRGLLGTTLETRPAGKIVLRLSVMTANMDAVLVNTLQQAEARRVQRRAGAAMLRSDVPAVVGGKVLSGGYARDQEDEESETEGLRFVR